MTCRVYRRRDARKTPLVQLLESLYEAVKLAWEERFEAPHGLWRGSWDETVAHYLDCGVWNAGFARLWCAKCRRSVLVAFSCRGRSFCPSCEKKKQLLWAEWLREELLAPVAHRHVVLTIPRLLQPLLRRRRELLTEQGRAAADQDFVQRLEEEA